MVMFCSARSPALKAVMAIGVACTVDSRFSAVTMISSSSPPPLAGAVLAGVAGVGRTGRIRIRHRRAAQQRGAENCEDRGRTEESGRVSGTQRFAH